MRRIQLTSCFAVMLVLAACGSDETDSQPADDCPPGQVENPVSGDCVRETDPNNRTPGPPTDAGGTDSADAADAPDDDAGDADLEEPDLAADMPDLGCVDEDGDGALSAACGGDDCDDTDDRRRPDGAEICDEVDNDCDGEVNEDLDCSIFAHSSSRLYKVDLFAGTFDDLGPTISNLWDIDSHPNGTMYGIAGSYLHTYVPATGEWVRAAEPLGFLEIPNGFCIDNDGTAYVTSGTTNTLRTVDLSTGSSSSVGSMAPASSSGDCVVTKGNVLFMTSDHTTPDSLAQIDGDTGASTIVGQTSHDGIWGLTAAYNRLFGMTSDGDVVEIDPDTGATTVVQSYPTLSFFGAASTPDR